MKTRLCLEPLEDRCLPSVNLLAPLSAPPGAPQAVLVPAVQDLRAVLEDFAYNQFASLGGRHLDAKLAYRAAKSLRDAYLAGTPGVTLADVHRATLLAARLAKGYESSKEMRDDLDAFLTNEDLDTMLPGFLAAESDYVQGLYAGYTAARAHYRYVRDNDLAGQFKARLEMVRAHAFWRAAQRDFDALEQAVGVLP